MKKSINFLLIILSLSAYPQDNSEYEKITTKLEIDLSCYTKINWIDSFNIIYDTVVVYDTILYVDTVVYTEPSTTLPPGMQKILSTNFTNTELSVYDDGNDWNYSIKGEDWNNNPNFTNDLKIQTEVESANSLLTDYAETRIVGDKMVLNVFKLDGVSSGTRLQLQGSLQRSDVSKMYISFDMYLSSDIKKAYDLYGNSCSFVFSEFHSNGNGYGTRARFTYVDGKVVYHANCKKRGNVIWAAGTPSGGRVEVQFEQWEHVDILCEVEQNGNGRYRIWVNSKIAVDEIQMLGYPIKSNIHWIKDYPDGDIISVSDNGIYAVFDNLDVYINE